MKSADRYIRTRKGIEGHEKDICSGLMKPDTHLGENARQLEVSDNQATALLYS
mgnify:CR=1 FL=1